LGALALPWLANQKWETARGVIWLTPLAKRSVWDAMLGVP